MFVRKAKEVIEQKTHNANENGNDVGADLFVEIKASFVGFRLRDF